MPNERKHDKDDEKDPAATAGAAAGAALAKEKTPATPKGMRRVRLVRSIILSGEHEDAESVHDVSLPLAQRLIGEGSAVQHLEEGESSDPQALTVNRMEDPENRDPKSIRISRPAPKVKQPAPDKK